MTPKEIARVLISLLVLGAVVLLANRLVGKAMSGAVT